MMAWAMAVIVAVIAAIPVAVLVSMAFVQRPTGRLQRASTHCSDKRQQRHADEGLVNHRHGVSLARPRPGPHPSYTPRMRRPTTVVLSTCLSVGAALAALVMGGACNAGGATTGASSTTSGGGDFTSTATGAGGIDENAACAEASDEAKNVPVNLYIMFDKSGSMTGTKWSQSTAALQAFFSDPASAGLRVALRFFPDTGCDENCNVAPCAVPKVEAGELTSLSAPTDVQEQALLDAFVGVVPSGGTPLSTALGGALTWGATVLSTAPSEKAVVALVTDGFPEDCDASQNNFVNAAKGALDTNGVLTFAIGLEGANQNLMDAIAMAGGTTSSVVIGTANAQQDLVDALNEIRETTLACEYEVPTLVDGNTVDPNRVNVLYQTGSGQTLTLGQVADEAACTTTSGWYYDDPSMPTRILFCPSTCISIRDDPQAAIELLFGCLTVPA